VAGPLPRRLACPSCSLGLVSRSPSAPMSTRWPSPPVALRPHWWVDGGLAPPGGLAPGGVGASGSVVDRLGQPPALAVPRPAGSPRVLPSLSLGCGVLLWAPRGASCQASGMPARPLPRLRAWGGGGEPSASRSPASAPGTAVRPAGAAARGGGSGPAASRPGCACTSSVSKRVAGRGGT